MNATTANLSAFGSSCKVVISSPDQNENELIQEVQAELDRLHSKFSSLADSSVIKQINQSAGTGAYTALDAESRSLFDYISALWSQSSHLFDPTTCLLQNCYDDRGKLTASDTQLKDMLKLVGWSKLELNEDGALLTNKGMLIDMNSSIKPYAVDSIRRLLISRGVEHALIEMDRDAAAIGRQFDGANWLIGVRHPHGPRTAITRLKLNGKGFSMRGDFEHRVRLYNENFGRGLSPVDGYPVPGLLSVVVIADDCLTACSAASIARLKTEPAAIKWLDSLGMPWMAIDRKLVCHGPLAPSKLKF